MGLFLPKGRAFSYDGKGILLLSPLPQEADKVLGQLKSDLGGRVNVLARGIPTLYHEPNSKLNTVAYPSDIGGNTYPDFTPILYPSPDAKSFNVRAVFMLNDGSSKTHRVDRMPSNAILNYFLWVGGITELPDVPQRYLQQFYTTVNALSNAYIFATGTGNWFEYNRKLAMVGREIENTLSTLATARATR